MVRPLVKDDLLLLSRKSAPAEEEDVKTAQDLADTLHAHRETCAGMAANMIGVNRRIIAFYDGGSITVMFNPEIVKQSGGAYEAEEGCLSLTGTRKTKRYQSVKVKYQNEKFQTRLKTYTGFAAQVVQHEVDHLNGIII